MDIHPLHAFCSVAPARRDSQWKSTIDGVPLRRAFIDMRHRLPR
ncbi:hypothetical protein GJA_3656 [Janthinobacterium agaricidamnosum NBRC 102515 = DSM 9628]|uniref:Uncharacterized protein n=1 Tax=Janthinobacterium agaricidamnosum NBRC 102515 = DSM 9628 TaxID=1349767 RepID=W0V8Q8_9BURK|nr:hypothetical protein GJA_3656 [Janthinobacterium agaricidamnosum NBRC 102515 = DSM 9628]